MAKRGLPFMVEEEARVWYADWNERGAEVARRVTPHGQYDHPELRPLTERCIMFASNAGPPMLPNGSYNNNYTIVQTAYYVMIHSEVVHDTRIIRLGNPHRLPDHIRQWLGDS